MSTPRLFNKSAAGSLSPGFFIVVLEQSEG